MSQASPELPMRTRRGLGMPCPDPVSELLKASNWKGYNGWWLREIHGASKRMRWYEAVAAEMRGDTSSRKRKADASVEPTSCARTVDMFVAGAP